MAFDTFSLDSKILKAIADAGYTTPTDIQLAAIPKITSGADIRASAQTGTGKTAAFLLPALNRLVSEESLGRGPRLLILSPTRELAMQIATQSDKYSRHLKRMKSVCICGGVPYRVQMKQMERPYEILIATPGRLIDYLHQGKIDLSSIEMLVLDEADRMLDMGFLEPVEEIVAAIPEKRQTLLFSATLKGPIIKLSQRLLKDPVDVVIEGDTTTHENIAQKIHYVDDMHHKNRLLDHILDGEDVGHTIVFTSTKRHADQLVFELKDKGQRAAALHGDMSQRQRTRTIAQLRNGTVKVLVATDVAARGIDVRSVTHVVNYDLPRNVEDYVHRIGRTGRAGAKGTALSLVGGQDAPLVPRIERYTGEKLEVFEIEGFEPSKKRSSFDSKRGSGRPRGHLGRGQGGGQGGRFGQSSGERGGRSGGERDGRSGGGGRFGKPSGERNYGKPSGERNYGKPSGERNYGKPSGERNYGKPSGERNYGKPSGERNYGKPGGRFGKSPGGNGGYGKPSGGKGGFGKPSGEGAGRFAKASTGRPGQRFGKPTKRRAG